MFICNGRLDKDRLIGQFTFRKTSVIDYTLGTIDALRLIDQFSIFETDTIYSDGHSILSHAFAPSNSATNEDNHVTGNSSRPKWDDSYSNIFCKNIDTEELKSVSSILDSTSSAEDRVNRATESIAKLFSDASNRNFPMHNKKKLCQKKPWFGPLCRSARKKYHAAKKYYNSCQSSINMHRLKEASKSYKKTMNKFISKSRKQNENKLRNLQSKKPKQYWNFLNSLKHRSNSNSPSLNEFYEYFRDLNSADLENADLSDFDYLHSSDENLNKEITYEEVSRCIDRLNNGKASGIDRILNEHIKTTKYTFITIYVKLFNLVLDSGCFPEQWSTGMISPIYKKEDRSNPQNYRPITILSCLGKLFTSVLNARLNDYLEDCISENQAGFRKTYSTLDHIFSMYALIELLKSQKKKLFCCFVDFSSAFDSVWRVGLWQKILAHKVNGKVFRIIFNMYSGIKSCVSVMGKNSPLFCSYAGVRQGENLSPILFSMYLNDLGNFLEDSQVNGIPLDVDNDELVHFSKLAVLLYADDTVLLANNEQDLQNSLDAFYSYCERWITDRYKYLGIIFSQSRSFLNARKHIVEQARKAMHLLFCRINNLYIPIDLQLLLFDQTIVPILIVKGLEI